MMKSQFDSIAFAMPMSFDFYERGWFDQVPAKEEEIQDEVLNALGSQRTRGISFDIYTLSDQVNRILLILLVQDGDDVAIYEEAGNILSSQIANTLADDTPWMPSPPRLLEPKQILRLMENQPDLILRKYLHRYKGTEISLQAIVIPYPYAETISV
jgi:hypothetical protein